MSILNKMCIMSVDEKLRNIWEFARLYNEYTEPGDDDASGERFIACGKCWSNECTEHRICYCSCGKKPIVYNSDTPGLIYVKCEECEKRAVTLNEWTQTGKSFGKLLCNWCGSVYMISVKGYLKCGCGCSGVMKFEPLAFLYYHNVMAKCDKCGKITDVPVDTRAFNVGSPIVR